ncbi:MAG: hypothetical protein K1X55_01890 [Chitinophagales bacterium]|nr:hypothetical protein [Chitinophagales bacterium]
MIQKRIRTRVKAINYLKMNKKFILLFFIPILISSCSINLNKLIVNKEWYTSENIFDTIYQDKILVSSRNLYLNKFDYDPCHYFFYKPIVTNESKSKIMEFGSVINCQDQRWVTTSLNSEYKIFKRNGEFYIFFRIDGREITLKINNIINSIYQVDGQSYTILLVSAV